MNTRPHADLALQGKVAIVAGGGAAGDGIGNGRAALFLASGWARCITGRTLVVDGGGTLAGPPRATGAEAAQVSGHDG